MQIALSGERYFLDRYQRLISAIEPNPDRRVLVPTRLPAWFVRYHVLSRRIGRRILGKVAWSIRERDPDKSPLSFRLKSRNLRRDLASAKVTSVVHLFCQSSPAPMPDGTPVFFSLDFTLALAIREYPAWTGGRSAGETRRWLRLEREAYHAAAGLLPWSRKVAASLEQDYGVPPERITVTGFSGNVPDTPMMSEGFRGGTLLMNASDPHRKGLDLAVEALGLLRARWPQSRLRVLGLSSGPQAEGVEYLGQVKGPEAVGRCFAESDLVLAPARCEPYGSFLVEAMAHAKPCVVSNSGGMPEIVASGETGIVLDRLDPGSLAAAIDSYLGSPERILLHGMAARGRYERDFTWEKIATRVREALARSPEWQKKGAS